MVDFLHHNSFRGSGLNALDIDRVQTASIDCMVLKSVTILNRLHRINSILSLKCYNSALRRRFVLDVGLRIVRTTGDSAC
jgi:hypothetical protein